jgi:hypothetical protein
VCNLKVYFPGDQSHVEKSRGGIFARTPETSPQERLSPFIPLPQEFHAEKVNNNNCKFRTFNIASIKENMLIWREGFDLMGQNEEPGTVSWVKSVFGHTKVMT